jgi:hypothetical protein
MTPEIEKQIREKIQKHHACRSIDDEDYLDGDHVEDLEQLLAEIDRLREGVSIYTSHCDSLGNKLAVAIEALESMLSHICDGGGDFPCSQMWYQDVAQEALSKIRGEK